MRPDIGHLGYGVVHDLPLDGRAPLVRPCRRLVRVEIVKAVTPGVIPVALVASRALLLFTPAITVGTDRRRYSGARPG